MTWTWRSASPSASASCTSGRSWSRGPAPKWSIIRAPRRSTLASDALALRNVDAFYGDSHVLHGVSFTLGEARLLGLLGRNGAGKTTCMNVAMGLLVPRPGAVAIGGTDVTGSPPEDIAARG